MGRLALFIFAVLAVANGDIANGEAFVGPHAAESQQRSTSAFERTARASERATWTAADCDLNEVAAPTSPVCVNSLELCGARSCHLLGASARYNGAAGLLPAPPRRSLRAESVILQV